eukprot:2306402-Pyramimonas_sp.AAC.1
MLLGGAGGGRHCWQTGGQRCMPRRMRRGGTDEEETGNGEQKKEEGGRMRTLQVWILNMRSSTSRKDRGHCSRLAQGHGA